MPLFSIVIPTRNRAGLLKLAIESALAQQSDIEVIVCDNDSSDETGAIAASFQDARLRYVRTEATLPAADNWNFALGHATGCYALMLADDDYLLPAWSTRMEQVIDTYAPQIVTSGFVAYRLDRTGKGSVEKATFDQKVHWFDGDALVRTSLQSFHLLDPKIGLPPLDPFRFHPSVVCFRRDIYERAWSQYGTFFLFPEPMSGYLLLFAMGQRYFHLDIPLSIIGRYPDSHTVRPSTTWQNLETKMVHVPLKGQYLTNLVVETYLRMFQIAGDILCHPNTRIMPSYYGAYYAEMIKQRDVNPRFQDEYDAFYQIVEGLPTETRDQVLLQIDQRLAESHSAPANPPRRSLSRNFKRRIRQGLEALSVIGPQSKTARWLALDQIGVQNLTELGHWLENQYAE